MNTRARVGALLLLLAMTNVAAEDKPAAVSWSQQVNQPPILTIDWCIASNVGAKAANCSQTSTGSAKPPRISDEDTVFVQVRNFNFVLYGLSLDVAEKNIESYQKMAELLEKIAGYGSKVSSLTISGVSGQDFRSAFGALVGAVSDLEQSSKRVVGPEGLTNIWISTAQQATIDQFITDLSGNVGTVGEKNRALRSTVATSAELAEYDVLQPRVDSVVSVAKSLIKGLRQTREGKQFTVPAKRAGTLVTVTLKPSALSEGQADAASVSAKYFVETHYPFVFSLGVAHADISDFSFQEVRASTSQDLFAKIGGGESVEGLAAFLSYPLWQIHKEREVQLLGSFGTDVDDAGKRFYLGLSLGFRRFVITVGGVTADVQEPNGEVQDSGRTLYQTIKESREYGAFASIGVFAF